MASDKLMALDKLQRADHDALVRVETKLDGLIVDVKTMNDGMVAKLADHDTRIRTLEDNEKSIGGIKEAWKRFLDVERIVHDTLVTANVYRIVAGFAGGIMVYLLTQLPTILKLLGVIQ